MQESRPTTLLNFGISGHLPVNGCKLTNSIRPSRLLTQMTRYSFIRPPKRPALPSSKTHHELPEYRNPKLGQPFPNRQILPTKTKISPIPKTFSDFKNQK
jgi:hypothetical protein